MEKDQQLYVIYNIEDYGHDGGEIKKVIATRMTSEEKIKEEIKLLNDTCTEPAGFPDLYFEYEQLEVLESGYNSNFTKNSTDESLNKLALVNELTSDFDRHVEVYFRGKARSEGIYTFKSFEESTIEQYGKFFNNVTDYQEVIKIIEDLFEQGKIKSNVKAIIADEEKQDIKDTLESNMSVKSLIRKN